MKLAIRCRCGKLQGELDSQGVAARATCYCKSCQVYARFLQAQPDFLDDAGGTDVAPSRPSALRFTSGAEHLACMSLSDKGIYRWYASCCRTPIANTAPTRKVAFVGVPRVALAESAAVIDRELGPARTVLNTESATRPVTPTPARVGWASVKIGKMILGARLTGRYKNTPFFDANTHRPVRPVQVLTEQERAALG